MIRRRTLLRLTPIVALAPESVRAQAVEVRLGATKKDDSVAPFAVALVESLKAVDPILDMKLVETKGSTENVKLLQSGDIDVGMVSGEVMHEWVDQHSGQPQLKVISVIQSTPGMLAVRPDSRFRKIDDLKGRPVVWGPRSSGSAVQARYVMDGLGLDLERDFQAIYPEKVSDGPTLVIDRKAAALWGSGYRSPGFIELANQPGGTRFLVPNAAEIARIRQKYPFLVVMNVPAGLYPAQYDPIVTVGAWSFILARPDLDDIVGYRLARSLYRAERSGLPSKHTVQTTVRNTLIAIASTDELQAGVLRFYREAKLVK